MLTAPGLHLRISGLGFSVWGLGFRIQGLGFRASGSPCFWVWGAGLGSDWLRV